MVGSVMKVFEMRLVHPTETDVSHENIPDTAPLLKSESLESVADSVESCPSALETSNVERKCEECGEALKSAGCPDETR